MIFPSASAGLNPSGLDAGDLPLDEIEKSLGDIRRVNRFWGGRRAADVSLLRAITPPAARSPCSTSAPALAIFRPTSGAARRAWAFR